MNFVSKFSSCFLAVFLVAQLSCVTALDSTVVRIELANQESQYSGQYLSDAINVTLNIPSSANISDSLELCADTGNPFLFVKNSTILGCGTLLWTNGEKTPLNGGMTSLISTPNGAVYTSANSPQNGSIVPVLNNDVMFTPNATIFLTPNATTISNQSRTIAHSNVANATVTLPFNKTTTNSNPIATINSTPTITVSSPSASSNPNATMVSDAIATLSSGSNGTIASPTNSPNGTAVSYLTASMNPTLNITVSSLNSTINRNGAGVTLITNVSTINLNGITTSPRNDAVSLTANATILNRNTTAIPSRHATITSSLNTPKSLLPIATMNSTRNGSMIMHTTLQRTSALSSSVTPSRIQLSNTSNSTPNLSSNTSVAETILSSFSEVHMNTTLALNSNASLSSNPSSGGTLSNNGTLRINASIEPSPTMVNATIDWLPMNKTIFSSDFDATNFFSVTNRILSSSTMVYDANTSLSRRLFNSSLNGLKFTIQPSITTTNMSTKAFCNKTKQLLKAYKTELYKEVSIAVFARTNYTTRIPNAGKLQLNCSFTPGDKTPVAWVITDASFISFTHRYFSPGRYRARVKCSHNSSVLTSASRRVVVSLSLVHTEVSCPTKFLQTNRTYVCTFNVDQGSALDVGITTQGHMEINTRFSETPPGVISAENEANDVLNSTTSYHPLLVFKNAFYIRCIELVFNVTGLINLKILRPSEDPKTFSSEASGSLSCPNISSSDPVICFQTFTNTLRDSASNLSTTHFTDVHTITVTTKTGYNFITLPNSEVFKAQPNDVLVVDQSDHSTASRSTPSVNATSSPGSQSNTTLRDSIFNKFSLFGFVPYEAKISLRFTNPGILPLGINVRESGRIVSAFGSVFTILRAVSGLALHYKRFVTVNESRKIGFELSHGTNASCDWVLSGSEIILVGFGDCKGNSSKDEGVETSFQYPHDTPGMYYFYVKCSNLVSTISENVSISVRRNISDLKASLCFATFSYAHAQTCWTATASGDHVGYLWIIDYMVYRKRNVAMIYYKSTVPGSPSPVYVTVSNVISKEKLTLYVNVLKNPLEIQIQPAFTVPSKSVVNITAVIRWSPEELFAEYGINISQPLRNFIDFPTFRLAINGQTVASNITNGTLLTHTFPSVGLWSRIHKVYVEAIGHPELNRQIVVRIVDVIANVMIHSTCSNKLFSREKCNFTVTSYGSDVRYDWRIESYRFYDTSKISYYFDELGEFAVTVTARNQLSSQNAVFNITLSNHTAVLEPSSTAMFSSSTETANRPSSQSVATAPKILKIFAPPYAAVGKTVPFHALNANSSATVTWFINNTKLKTTNSTITWVFNQPGVFQVLANNSNQSANFTINIQVPITSFQMYVYQKPFAKRVNVLFSIASGTDVSYLVNFDDNSVTRRGNIRELMRNTSVFHLFTTPGSYNLSVSVSSEVGPKKTRYSIIYVNDTCKIESSVLYGASSNSNSSLQFTDNDEVTIALRMPFDCATAPQLNYTWTVIRLNSSIPNGITIGLPSNNSAVFQFSASRTSIGDYKLLATVENCQDGSSITRIGYLSKIPKTLSVRIKCGTMRMVSVDESLTIRAVVVPSSGNVTNFNYEWFCDQRFNISCFGRDVLRNKSALQFPGNYFEVGHVYEFVVYVSDGVNRGVTSQEVEFAAGKEALDLCLSFSSSFSDELSVLHSRESKIVPACPKCLAIPNLKWSWRITNIITVDNSTSESVVVKNLILDSSELYIPTNTFKPNTLYRIKVNTSSETHNTSGRASYEFKTNDIPTRGYCDIKSYPSSSFLTPFQARCYAWYDKDQPLTYEYWYSTDGTWYKVFHKCKNPVSELVFFDNGLAKRNYLISVKFIIIDSLGESSVIFLTTQNFPPSDEQIAELFKSSHAIDNQVESFLNNRHIDGAVLYLHTITNILTENSILAEESQRIEIRERILQNLDSLCCTDRVAMKQIVEIILSILNEPSEMNYNAQLLASNLFLNITENLNLLSSNAEVLTMAEQLVTGVSLLLSAVSLSNNQTEMNQINEALLLIIDKLGETLLSQANPGDRPIIISTSSLTMALQKHFTNGFPGKRLSVPNHATEFEIPRKMKPIQGLFVSSKMISMLTNPFLSQHSLKPTTGVASLELFDPHGNGLEMNNLVEPFNIILDRRNSPDVPTQTSLQSPTAHLSQYPTAHSTHSFPEHTSKLNEDSDPDFYVINTTRTNPSILVTITQISTRNKGQLHLRVSKANQSEVMENEIIVQTTSSFPLSRTWRELPGYGTYYVSVTFESLAFRLAGKPNSIEYSISFEELDCHFWNAARGEWKSTGCKVGLRSTTTTTHCECNHLTWFGARVVVPPNTISLSKISERIADPSNYVTILSVFSFLLVVYCLLVVWARRRDIGDEGKNGIIWCPSNQPSDSHQYQVIIYTGIRRNAGTTANVGLMLSGDLGRSRKCLLKNSKRAVLKRGYVDSFFVTTNRSVGPLDYIHIWHDNTGSDPAWFLNRVVVRDLDTGDVSNFLCYSWLAVDEGDGRIQRLLPVAAEEDLRRFRHLFVSRATSELTDAHLWFSVALRPARSSFTRVQRVSCCLSLLLTSMMANAMWYQTGGSGSASHINLGLFSFSWDEVFIGVCSSLIVFPVNLLLVQIFRHCRTKRQSSPSLRRPSIMQALELSRFNYNFPIITVRSHDDSADGSRDTMTSCQKTFYGGHKVNGVRRLSVALKISPEASRSVTSFQSRVSLLAQGARKGKYEKVLPYWWQYVGWVGVLVTCLVSASVTVLYALEFGEDKTRKWLLSLTISLINDVFIAQPLKVLVVAVVLAYVLKRPLKEHYVSSGVIDTQEMDKTVPPEESQAPDFDLCSTDEFLRNARKKREKEKFMYGLLRTVFSHLCFTVLVLIIAYGQRDVHGYHSTVTTENTFVYQEFKTHFVKKEALQSGFYRVTNVEDFWSWNEAVFLPSLSNSEWHNYTSEWSTFTANFGGFLFGAARMRQKRLKQGKCDVLPLFKNIIPSCTGQYEWSNEDESNYEKTWANKSHGNLCDIEGQLPPERWCYKRLNQLITDTYVGTLKTYSGGGYAQDYSQNYELSVNRTNYLKEHLWIDKYTRAVFVEFTLYNPNVNLFSIVTLVFEISASGDFNPRSNILPIRLYSYVGNFQIFVLVCQLIFLGFLCTYTYNSVKGIFLQRLKFFSKAWHLYEIGVVLIAWLAVAVYFVAILFRNRILGEFRKDPTRYTNFRYSVSWQMTLEYVIACLVFITFLKFMKLFQFNRRMYLLPLTLTSAKKELISFSVVFAVILVAFSLLYFLILQAYNPNFVSIITSMETLLRVFLGKSDVLVRRTQFPVLEYIIVFLYMCLMRFIMLNLIVAILNESFSSARALNDAQRNAFEFVDFIKHAIRDLLGIRRLEVVGKKFTDPTLVEYSADFEEGNMMWNVEDALRKMSNKVDDLVKRVDSECFQEVFHDDVWSFLNSHIQTAQFDDILTIIWLEQILSDSA